MSRRVLVLDGDRASTLAIVRSLGRRGIPVDVGSAAECSLAAASRYAEDSLLYPDPGSSRQAFQTWCLKVASERAYSLIVPVTDMTIVPIMSVRSELEKHARLAMASNASIEVTLSKSRSAELAMSARVPVPKTWVIRQASEVVECLESADLPLAIKPERSNVWSPGASGRRLAVTYGRSPEEAQQRILGYLHAGPVTVQEFVLGSGTGVGILAAEGKVLFAFQYRRLHEVPLTGGASSYRESRPLDPILRAQCEELIRRLNWDGVAMVEFKEAAGDDGFCFMEINGRFWGSLPLAVAAGADFPSFLFDSMVEGRRDFPTSYRVGVRARDLWRDLAWMRAALRFDPKLPVERPDKARIVGDALALLRRHEHLDTLRLDDPRPGILALRRNAREVLGRIRGWVWLRARRRHLARVKTRDGLEGRRRWIEAKTIVVLCQGNHVRSPFAAALLSERVGGAEKTVLSAGLDVIPGRGAHARAVRRARDLGLDLDHHAAEPFTERMAREADLILCMEMNQLRTLHRMFPLAEERALLLGCLAPEGPLEIADPDGREPEAFDRAFQAIETIVGSLG